MQRKHPSRALPQGPPPQAVVLPARSGRNPRRADSNPGTSCKGPVIVQEVSLNISMQGNEGFSQHKFGCMLWGSGMMTVVSITVYEVVPGNASRGGRTRRQQ